jgi:hypothetical protein
VASPGIGFVSHISPSGAPPDRPNWVRFAHFALRAPAFREVGPDWVCLYSRPRKPWGQAAGLCESAIAELGSFRMIGIGLEWWNDRTVEYRGISPGEVGFVCTSSPAGGPLSGFPPGGEIGFVLHNRPAPAARLARNWVCFARVFTTERAPKRGIMRLGTQARRPRRMKSRSCLSRSPKAPLRSLCLCGEPLQIGPARVVRSLPSAFRS